MLKAGYRQRGPATAEAVVDCRIFPAASAFEAEVDELIGPDVTREWTTSLPSYETTFDGDLVDAMNAALLAVDPDARTVPYMLSGGLTRKPSALVFAASALPRCGSRRIWISRRCSTASMSGYPSTH